ncbi:MAG: hypothetical protein KDK34_07140, partial [Leptospiraceae bacterium]|nr:hypothetical protein [Leptospiraceae bacterium]
MAKDISVLNPDQFQEVRNALLELVKTLNARKAPGSSNMIPDEDIVLTSIQHPERGDVLITVIPDRTGLQIFVSNRRDPDNPFAIMSHRELRDFPGRRPLNHSVSTLKEGQRGLFLITVQDRELLRAHQLDAIQGYSSRFNVAEKRDDGPV